MPLRDGTGPLGRGARTGRRKGGCYTIFGYNSLFHSGFNRKYGWLLGIMVPLGTAILRDLLNPSGVIRRIMNVSSAPKITSDTQKTKRNAEFTVMDNNSVPIVHTKKTS